MRNKRNTQQQILPFSLVHFQALFSPSLLHADPISLTDYARYELRQTDEGMFLLRGTRRALQDQWHLSSLVDPTLDAYYPVIIKPHGPSFLISGLSSLYRAFHGQPYIPFTTMQIPELGEHHFRYGSSFPFRLVLQEPCL